MEIASVMPSFTQLSTSQKQPNTAGEQMGEILQDFSQVMKNAEKTANDAMMGEATPHELVEALAQAQLAVETAVTVREKVVEAYQEILRMPV